MRGREWSKKPNTVNIVNVQPTSSQNAMPSLMEAVKHVSARFAGSICAFAWCAEKSFATAILSSTRRRRAQLRAMDRTTAVTIFCVVCGNPLSQEDAEKYLRVAHKGAPTHKESCKKAWRNIRDSRKKSYRVSPQEFAAVLRLRRATMKDSSNKELEAVTAVG